MARLLYLLIGFAIGIMLAVASIPRSAHSAGLLGSCTANERIALGKVGYTKQEIAEVCAPSAVLPRMPTEPYAILRGEGQPRWSHWCATSQGRCWVNPAITGSTQPGAACNCYMTWGTYNGFIE